MLALASDDYDGPPSLPSGPTSFLAARASALTSLDDRGQDLIADLLQLAPGTTTGPAIELLQSRKIVEKLLTLVDADSDGKLCFEEMTSADVVGIAEQVAADLDVQAADIEVNEDLARALIQSYQQGLKEAILPGLTDDEELGSRRRHEHRMAVRALAARGRSGSCRTPRWLCRRRLCR